MDVNPILKDFPARVRYAMKTLGLTQQQVAFHLGVGQATVAGWLKDSTPQPRTVKLLAAALHTREEWLLNGTGKLWDSGQSLERIRREFLQKPVDHRSLLEQVLGMMTESSIEEQIEAAKERNAFDHAQFLIDYLEGRRRVTPIVRMPPVLKVAEQPPLPYGKKKPPS